MWPIATDDPVARSVCLSVTRLRCAKTAKKMEVLFGVETLGDPRHIVLDVVPITLQRGVSMRSLPN